MPAEVALRPDPERQTNRYGTELSCGYGACTCVQYEHYSSLLQCTFAEDAAYDSYSLDQRDQKLAKGVNIRLGHHAHIAQCSTQIPVCKMIMLRNKAVCWSCTATQENNGMRLLLITLHASGKDAQVLPIAKMWMSTPPCYGSPHPHRHPHRCPVTFLTPTKGHEQRKVCIWAEQGGSAAVEEQQRIEEGTNGEN